jgi:putative ABC transport system substrate-binding protein
MRRIGVLMGYAETDPAPQAQGAVLRQELHKLGWNEGRNIRIDVRFPGTDAGRVRAFFMELMSLTPDVLVSNTNLVTAVVQAEVRTLPSVVPFTSSRRRRIASCMTSPLRPRGISSPPSK